MSSTPVTGAPISTSGAPGTVNRADTSSLMLFLFLNFAIAWTCWLLAPAWRATAFFVQLPGLKINLKCDFLLALFGNLAPGLAAIIVTLVDCGRPGLRRLLRSAFDWRVAFSWYAVAILLPPGLGLLAVSAYEFFGHVHWWPWISIFWISNVFGNLPLAPFCEEIGWRGYLLPYLQNRRSGLSASLILGLIWGFWHVPLHLYVYNLRFSPVLYPFLTLFIIQVIGLAIILTWIWNKARNSLLPCTLFHSSIEATAIYVVGPAIIAAGLAPYIVSVCFLWAFALAILWKEGPGLGLTVAAANPGGLIPGNQNIGMPGPETQC